MIGTRSSAGTMGTMLGSIINENDIASMNDTLYMHHHETSLVYAYLSREDRIAFERMDLHFDMYILRDKRFLKTIWKCNAIINIPRQLLKQCKAIHLNEAIKLQFIQCIDCSKHIFQGTTRDLVPSLSDHILVINTIYTTNCACSFNHLICFVDIIVLFSLCDSFADSYDCPQWSNAEEYV